jgi:hypothetical protein
MPRVVRIMKHDKNDESIPRVGDSFGCLGVRPRDIDADKAGNVQPCRRGMSVAPRLTALPFTMVPGKYANIVEGAIGSPDQSAWEIGKGEFRDGAFESELLLEVTSPTHGVIGPDRQMLLSGFKSALEATQKKWRVI